MIFSAAQFAEIDAQAQRLDRSLSWVVTRAAEFAESHLSALQSRDESDRLNAADAVERELSFPEPTLRFLHAQATRLDCSVSYLVRRAWVFSRSSILALTEAR